MDPYVPDSTWLWDQIAQPEAQGDRRRAIWWSDTVVALILREAIPGTLAKGLAGAHFGEKDQMKLKNETVG